jgi:hypothetical protein
MSSLPATEFDKEFLINLNIPLKVVYSSGVDPVLMQFQPVIKNSTEQRRKWVKSIQRSTNTHDVRALACIGNKKVHEGFLRFAQ